jgi:hypothetical protein
VNEFSSARLEELKQRADQRKIDWREKTRDLPQDDTRVLILALATSLGIDAIQALDERVALDQLEKEAEAWPAASAKLESDLAKSGTPAAGSR